MSRRISKLPSPQAVAAGQTAIVNIPLGPTYHRFDIDFAASTGADPVVPIAADDWGDYIGEIRLKVDGDVKIGITAERMMSRNKQYSQATVAGILSLFLHMPWARTAGGEDNGAYGTAAGMSTFTLEMDIKPGINVGLMEVSAEVSQQLPFGPHLQIRRFAKSFTVIGEDEIPDIPRGAYVLLGLDITSAEIGKVEVEAEQRITHESNKRVRENALLIAGRTPQPGMTHIDFMGQNRVDSSFQMNWTDFRIRLDFEAAPNAYDIYMTSLHRGAVV